MEIPYVVTPRKDTGLFNSKIAIWLFLASEVMLFGGFFSAYVFLRLGADYPWPERTLPVLPGLINTFVLIGSSVTVVFAWAALKMRDWRKFQLFMGITVFCAVIFMVLKGIEYNVKFHHQALRLKDFTVIEGHLGYEMDGDKPVLDHNGHKVEENQIFIETSKLTFSTVRFHKPWVEELLSQAGPSQVEDHSCCGCFRDHQRGPTCRSDRQSGRTTLDRPAQPDPESPSRRPQPQWCLPDRGPA